MTLEQLRDRVVAAALKFVTVDEGRYESDPYRAPARRELIALVSEFQRASTGDEPPKQITVPLARVFFELSYFEGEFRIWRSADRTRYWIGAETPQDESFITERLNLVAKKILARAVMPVEVLFSFELIPASRCVLRALRPDMVAEIPLDAEPCWPPRED